MENKNLTSYAIIDIGSNSMRLLVIRRNKKGQLFQINRSIHTTKLAKDLAQTGKISEEAIKRNIKALDDFVTIAKDYDVKEIYLFGTSAMRDAKNAQELINLIKEKFGLDVDVIDEKTEGYYGFKGIMLGHQANALAIDIGGASTELTYGNNQTIKNSVSLRLGCVRTSDMFIANQNNIKKEEMQTLYNYSYDLVRKALSTFNLVEPYELIGIGGTITALASIHLRLDAYDSSKIQDCVLTRKEIEGILKKASSLNLEQRERIEGLNPKRADTIVAGGIILLSIMKATNKDTIIVSDYDNLEGAAYIKFLSQSSDNK